MVDFINHHSQFLQHLSPQQRDCVLIGFAYMLGKGDSKIIELPLEWGKWVLYKQFPSTTPAGKLLTF